MTSPVHYLFWDLLPPEQREDPTIAPRKIDMRMFGLNPKPVILFGHKVSTIYYKNIDFTAPIFKCDRVANYEDGQPISLTRTPAFKKSDGSWGGSSTYTVAIYDPLAFWQKRRSRIVNELKKLAADTGLSAQILPVFEEYQTLVDSYRDAGSPKLRNAIASSTELWLDKVNLATGNKPRDVLVQYLSIGVVED